MFDARRTLPLGEWLIVLAILATIMAWGLLPGVAVGLALAVVVFAVRYSRTDLVRGAVSGADRRSNVDRPVSEREMLRTLGASIYVSASRGSSSSAPPSRCSIEFRERLGSSEAPPLRFLLVDLRRVTGVDSSAVLAFSRVAELGRAQGFEVILTGTEPPVRQQVEQAGVTDGDAPLRFEDDVDHGLERCEDLLLEGARAGREPRRRMPWTAPRWATSANASIRTSSGSRCPPAPW